MYSTTDPRPQVWDATGAFSIIYALCPHSTSLGQLQISMVAAYTMYPSSPGSTGVGSSMHRSSSSPALHMVATRNLHLCEKSSLTSICGSMDSPNRVESCQMVRSRSMGSLRGDTTLPRRQSSSDLKKTRRQRSVWRMAVADPLENFRDSFGNECALERRARKVRIPEFFL